jgi:hypothetical protein
MIWWVASTQSGRPSINATRAPSRAKMIDMALPLPAIALSVSAGREPAPVMMATLPANRFA